MRAIRNLLGLLIGLTLLGGIAAAVAAAMAKRQLVSHGGEEDDEVDLVAIYDGLDFTSRATAFRRGSVLTWFGGGDVDLREAALDPAGATLELRAVFGGLQLVVPETWRVEHRLVGVFGGTGDMRDTSMVATDGPILTITGFAVFGGIGITSKPLGGATPEPAEGPVEQAAEAGAGG